jgi:hypothetical protein
MKKLLPIAIVLLLVGVTLALTVDIRVTQTLCTRSGTIFDAILNFPGCVIQAFFNSVVQGRARTNGVYARVQQAG